MHRTFATTRRGRAGLIVVLAATLALLVTACEAPVSPAAKLFDAWKSGNPANATGAFTTYAAKTQMFSEAYAASAQWTFIVCEGAAGSTYCTWVNKREGQLVLRVDNASSKVTSVQRISLGNEPAGGAFHAWRVGDSTTGWIFPAPRADLFAKTYKASDHWLPTGCVSDIWVDCTWTNSAGKTIELTVDPPFNSVVGVSGTFMT